MNVYDSTKRNDIKSVAKRPWTSWPIGKKAFLKAILTKDRASRYQKIPKHKNISQKILKNKKKTNQLSLPGDTDDKIRLKQQSQNNTTKCRGITKSNSEFFKSPKIWYSYTYKSELASSLRIHY